MEELSSILGDAEAGAETQVNEQEQQNNEGHETTGDQSTAPPADEHQEQPEEEGDRRIKGLEAAKSAETRKRQQAEQRAQQLEQELAQLRQQQQQPLEKKPPTEGQVKELSRDDFASDAEYFRAIAKQEAQQLREADKAEQQRLQEQDRAQRDQQAEQAAIGDIVKKGQVKYRDFDTVINDGLGPFLTPQFIRLLMVSDKAEEIAYSLGKDPVEAERISGLPPAKMLHAIGLMEAKLTDEPQGSRAGPSTLTQARNAGGQYQKGYSGPTPLDDILERKT